MKRFSYYIIGGEILLISLLICSTICLYYQSQTINKQREFIKELTSKYYKFEEYKEAIKLADIIFDNNNIWDNDNSEIMNKYINIRSNIDNTFYEDFYNNSYTFNNIYFKNREDAIAVINNPNFKDILDNIYKN